MEKFGLSTNTYNQIKEIIDKYKQYEFKLFGSRARGDYKKTSDIDIAVLGEIDEEARYKILDEFDCLNIIYDIDIVFVDTTLRKEMLQSILKEGVEF